MCPKMFNFLLLIGVTLNAQSVNIRGNIANQSGKPVPDAVVELLGLGLKDTTGADGAYELTRAIVAVAPVPAPRNGKISFRRGILELRLPAPSPVKIEIFDVKGTLLKREPVREVRAGVYHVTLWENRLVTNLRIITVSTGERKMTFCHLPLRNGSQASSSSAGGITPVDDRLAKIEAVVDSLRITADGYMENVMTVSAYDTVLDITLDTAAGTACEGCGKIPPSDGKTTMDVDGVTREYLLKLPADYDPHKPYKLIFCPHPLGGTMDQIARQGFYGLQEVSDGSAIFVAPQGLKSGQYTGFSNTKGEDVAFFKAMLDRFTSTLCIDRKRVFSTGFSFGGMMSFAVGCAMWEEFRAIAPNSGSFVSQCDSSKQGPIAVWQSHGKSDEIMPISMGNTARDYFLKRNGCSDETVPVEPGIGNCVEYRGCREGYPYIYCAFDGGHAPQNWQAAAIWGFFSRF